MKEKILEPLKVLLMKLFKKKTKPRTARSYSRFLKLNPPNSLQFSLEQIQKVRGLNATRAIEEIKEARKAEEQ